MTPKEKAKQLIEEVSEHTQYWDCYNDCPLEYDHANKVALICISKQLELPVVAQNNLICSSK